MEYLETFETLLGEHGKLEAILESSINGIFEVSTEGSIIDSNPAAKQILHLSDQLPKGLPLAYVLPLDDLDLILSRLFMGDEEVIHIERHVPIDIGDNKTLPKYLELKFITIPSLGQKTIIILITDKTDVVKALENREQFITTLIKLVDELKIDNREIIYNLARLVEIRDSNTGKHLERVEGYTKLLAKEYQKHYKHQDSRITDEYVDDMSLSAVLHDIGKIGVSDLILQKPAKLSIAEFEQIKEHTTLAGEAMEKHQGKKDFLAMGREISLNHHEKWDGSGYPNGKKGEAIPLSGRVVSICDVYDALTSTRPYKKAFSHEMSVKIIFEGRGKDFDPKLIDLFMNIHPQFDKIRNSIID